MIRILLLLLLTGCVKEELITPCPHHVEIVGNKVHIEIVSELPNVEICISGRCLTVDKHYYRCISISLQDNDRVIEITAENHSYISIP